MTTRKMTLEQRVGAEIFARAGLAALSPQQQIILADWLEQYTKNMVEATERACLRQISQGGCPGPGGDQSPAQ